MTIPTVGRIVHYKSYGTPGGEFEPECRAAIIASDVNPLSMEATLVVVNPTGLFFNQQCKHDPHTKKGGTWHWPEGTPNA